MTQLINMTAKQRKLVMLRVTQEYVMVVKTLILTLKMIMKQKQKLKLKLKQRQFVRDWIPLEAEAEGDERADSVPAAGDLSDTHDVIIGVRAVELDTAEDQDVTGVKTYELDSPDGATAIDPRDHKEDIRIRSQKLLDSLIRGRKDCYICCQGLHDKSTAKSIDCDHEATAHFECLTDWFKVSII